MNAVGLGQDQNTHFWNTPGAAKIAIFEKKRRWIQNRNEYGGYRFLDAGWRFL